MAKAEKAQDLRGKKAEELLGRLSDLKKEQFNLRFQKASGQLADTSQFGRVRREIARIKTLLRERSAADRAAS